MGFAALNRHVSPRQPLACALASLLAVASLTACVEEATVTLPKNYNTVRNRSVAIDASKFLATDGSLVDASSLAPQKLLDYSGVCIGANCAQFKASATNGAKVASMQGINGTLKTLLPTDTDQTKLFATSASSLYATWMRIPVGYGCKPLLQSLFPDRTKPAGDVQKNAGDISNYNLTGLDALIGATRSTSAMPVWTVGYDIGTAGQGCAYANGQVQGQKIQDIDQWMAVVGNIAEWYDRVQPAMKNDLKTGDALCLSKDPSITRPWYCSHTLINFEFLRDPFGAGGYKADVPADRQAWLAAYKKFAMDLRTKHFWLPANGVVKIIGPSVVIKGDLAVQDSTSANRHPIYDFIDFVVAPANQYTLVSGKDAAGADVKETVRLPLSHLSLEVEAASPSEAKQILQRITDYAAAKGLKSEKYVDGAAGTEAIPIWIADLRISKLPAVVANLADPKSVTYDPWRASAWKGGFYAASKMLLQGLATEATIGNLVRVPTLDPDSPATDKAALVSTALDSDYLWFGQEDITAGSLKPAGWYSFWFHPDYMGGKQRVSVKHGPDALGMTGSASINPDSGIVVMATRSTCLTSQGGTTDCVPGVTTATDRNAFVTMGKKGVLRIMVSDFQVEQTGNLENLEHNLRIQVDGLPAGSKVAGYRWAWMDGTPPGTWTDFVYRELGIVDITSGSTSFTRTVPVPSVHYLELFYD